jgi:hypothetical protein
MNLVRGDIVMNKDVKIRSLEDKIITQTYIIKGLVMIMVAGFIIIKVIS